MWDSLCGLFFITNFLSMGDDLQCEILERFISGFFWKLDVVLWLAFGHCLAQGISKKELNLFSKDPTGWKAWDFVSIFLKQAN